METKTGCRFQVRRLLKQFHYAVEYYDYNGTTTSEWFITVQFVATKMILAWMPITIPIVILRSCSRNPGRS